MDNNKVQQSGDNGLAYDSNSIQELPKEETKPMVVKGLVVALILLLFFVLTVAQPLNLL